MKHNKPGGGGGGVLIEVQSSNLTQGQPLLNHSNIKTSFKYNFGNTAPGCSSLPDCSPDSGHNPHTGRSPHTD